ncbi:DNA polymerase III subunit gamma/tau [Deinococcus sonorensis]|uniref:DNA polymerase III subunit gamma/tau n=2 Tax=Deinococcus sonorensis TaxID=309891 RepID=A0AAU7UCY9_9DEIO
MSAIYQRARPIRWDQVVGQEQVKDVLRSALEQGRVGHAYLFSGPRGVGKTTTARLIAMTANCTGPLPKPCGECDSCLSVRAGSHPDVLEIDAASNNSVDDVRDLREKVGLSAMRGGKKIYILDEAHMMSRAAFNALLKTLEEPPGHVIFILATTEPEKIIPTILSRCQHFRFRRLTPEEVAGKLSGIARQEGVQAEPEALQLIGRLADGAMRDGESLLERMLASGEAVTRAGVEAALGLPPSERVREMAGALVQLDAGPLLGGARRLYQDGYAARTVVEGLVTALGEALHAELGVGDGVRLEGADVPRLLRLQAALDAQDARFARSADLQSLELALTHALIAGEGSGGSAAPAGAGTSPEVGQRLARLEKELAQLRAQGVAPVSRAPLAAPIEGALNEIPPLDVAGRGPRPEAARPVAVAAPAGGGNWADVVKLASMQTRAFLKPARMHAQQGYVSLTYDAKSTFHAKQVVEKFEELSRAVLKVFGPVTLEIIGPTPDTSRKTVVGGRAAAEASAGAPPVPAAAPVAVPAVPVAEVVADASRGEAPPVRPTPAPSTASAAIPEFQPAGRGRAAVQEPPPFTPVQRSGRGSPDDRAPAPLPDPAPPAAPPPEPLPREQRSTYIEPEPITQEPDWDDLGGPPDELPGVASAAVPDRPAPPARDVKKNDDVRPGPAPARGVVQDLRGHPLYQDATRRWAGRVREIGKVRRAAAADADEGADLPPEEAVEG